MSVTFDGATKIIQVDSGVTSIDVRDVYSRWKDWVLLSDNAKWNKAFRVSGGDPIGGGLYAPIFFFLVNGWTVRPDDTSGDHELTVALNLYSDPDTNARFTTVAGVTISNKTSDAAITNIELLEYSSFQNMITVDVDNGTAGTAFPIGTPASPSSNLTDALTVATTRGFTHINFVSDMTGVNKINSGSDLSGFLLTGRSKTEITLEIDTSVDTVGTIIRDATVYGTLDGNNYIQNCDVGEINYFNGRIENCGLFGTIYLDGSDKAILEGCYTIDQDFPPTIDMGGSGQSLAMPWYSGLITIKNLDSSTEEVGIGLDHGLVILDSTVTAGTIIISGVGNLTDNATSYDYINTSGLVNNHDIAHSVWEDDMTEHTTAGTAGKTLSDAKKKANLAASLSA